jgi:hypothetical protein
VPGRLNQFANRGIHLHSFFSRIFLLLAFLIVASIFSAVAARGEEAFPLSRGQAVYVPAYSHIYIGDREHPFYLTVTLSIRNTDPQTPLTLTSADYFDSNGKLLRRYIETPTAIAPFSSKRIIIKESDKEGGSGASFLVKWSATAPMNQPIIESIMIGTKSQQGISFSSRGQILVETAK